MHLFSLSRWTRCSPVFYLALVVSVMLASFQLLAQAKGKEPSMEHPTFYRTIQIDGLSIFYREAGPKEASTLLLLHGLPSSSRMFEPLFGFRIGIILSPLITRASGIAIGRTRKNSPTRSITMPRS
jgi:hypothetical protein